MGDKKRFDIEPKYLRINENTTEDILPINIEVPVALRSATFHEVSKLQNNQQQTTHLETPQLGITEQQLSDSKTASLFNL